MYGRLPGVTDSPIDYQMGFDPRMCGQSDGLSGGFRSKDVRTVRGTIGWVLINKHEDSQMDYRVGFY